MSTVSSSQPQVEQFVSLGVQKGFQHFKVFIFKPAIVTGINWWRVRIRSRLPDFATWKCALLALSTRASDVGGRNFSGWTRAPYRLIFEIAVANIWHWVRLDQPLWCTKLQKRKLPLLSPLQCRINSLSVITWLQYFHCGHSTNAVVRINFVPPGQSMHVLPVGYQLNLGPLTC